MQQRLVDTTQIFANDPRTAREHNRAKKICPNHS